MVPEYQKEGVEVAIIETAIVRTQATKLNAYGDGLVVDMKIVGVTAAGAVFSPVPPYVVALYV